MARIERNAKAQAAVDEPLVRAMATLLGPENPPVHVPLRVLGEVTGPENPPVHFLTQMLRGGDPMNVMGMGNPLVMGGMLPGAIWKTDAWGRRFKVDVETGQAAAKTAGEVAKEQAEHLAKVAAERKAEGIFRNVGFRNPKTGEVIEGTTNHPNSRDLVPADWPLAYDDGFITPDGKFLDRREALEYAEKMKGQKLDTAWPAMESVDAAQMGLYGDTLTGARDVFKAGEEAQRVWRDRLVEIGKEIGKHWSAPETLEEFLRRRKELLGTMDSVARAVRPPPQLGPARVPTPPPSPAGPVPTPTWWKEIVDRHNMRRTEPPVPQSQVGPSDPMAQLGPARVPTPPPQNAVPGFLGYRGQRVDADAIDRLMLQIRANDAADLAGVTPSGVQIPPGFDFQKDDAAKLIDAMIAKKKNAKRGK